MKIKEGVKLTGLQPQMVMAAIVINDVYQRNGQELVITSVIEGDHSKHSRHYLGYALDCRTRYFDKHHIPAIVDELREALGDDYYVRDEPSHIHVSFKPLTVTG